MENQAFTNQVAVITGAGIGIGFKIAEQLALQGASVVINDIEEGIAKQARKSIQEAGGICEYVAGDSSKQECIEAILEKAINSFGRIDIAIANAGITTFGNFLDYSPEEFDRLISVNLKGTFFLCQKASQLMIKQKSGGRLLLMSSVTGHQAHPDLTAYGMSKAAIRMLSKSLGVELGPYGITANALSPGATVTERTMGLEGDYMKEWERITPLGKPATTEDIAHAALFLLSPQAHHITGQTLIVDGGWTSYSPPPS